MSTDSSDSLNTYQEPYYRTKPNPPKDCIFCEIAAGSKKTAMLFSNSNIMIFHDANPIAIGHVIVAPKAHSENLFEIPRKTLEELVDALLVISQNIQTILKPERTMVVSMGGKVRHFHFHFIPSDERRFLEIGHRLLNDNSLRTAIDKDLLNEFVKQLSLRLKASINKRKEL